MVTPRSLCIPRFQPFPFSIPLQVRSLALPLFSEHLSGAASATASSVASFSSFPMGVCVSASCPLASPVWLIIRRKIYTSVGGSSSVGLNLAGGGVHSSIPNLEQSASRHGIDLCSPELFFSPVADSFFAASGPGAWFTHSTDCLTPDLWFVAARCRYRVRVCPGRLPYRSSHSSGSPISAITQTAQQYPCSRLATR